jgi:pilus assembly protein CpaB
MMNDRALITGLVAGAIGLVCNVLYLRKYQLEESGGAPVEVLVAVESIPRGKPIKEEVIGTRRIPQAYVDDRSVRSRDKGKIVNLRSTSTIPVGQTIAWTDVVAGSDEVRDLSSLVQPGNRALPLVVHQRDILQLIKSGDFVDIISVINGQSRVLLQKVLVLATGTDLSADRQARSDRGTMLTVSVSVAESQLLALAMDRGHLTVVVRNPDDQRVSDTLPDLNETSLKEATPNRNANRPRPQESAPTGPTRLEGGR